MTYTLTLADGTTYQITGRRPRHWKSALMQLAPYGTDFYGCRFSVSR